eukprot:114545_1
MESMRRRRRAHFLIEQILSRPSTNVIGMCFYRLRRAAMASLSAIEIQRTYRGWKGRQLAAFAKHVTKACIAVQSAFRGLKTRKQYLIWVNRRWWAAVQLQRMVRGRRARKRVKQRLQVVFDTGIAEIDQEVAQLEHQRLNGAAKVIQKCWKQSITWKIVLAELRHAREKEEREIKMKIAIAEHEQIVEGYKNEIENEFANLREGICAITITIQSSKEHRKQVMARQRFDKDKDKLRRNENTRKLYEKLEEKKIDEWQREWAVKEDEVWAIRRKCIDEALLHQDNADEKALAKRLKLETKKEAQRMIKLADMHGSNDLEWKEARDIAWEKVLEHEEKIEREQVKMAMRTAAEALLVEEERNKEIIQAEKDLSYPKRAVAAALSLQKMYYGWKSVQAVRQVAFQVYFKHFDPSYHQYYWENARLGTTSWSRPAALGSYDVDCDNEWLILHGDYDLIYYFNTRSAIISWEIPPGTSICHICNIQFSEYVHDRDGKTYCAACLEAHYEELGGHQSPLTFSPIRGGMVVGVEERLL